MISGNWSRLKGQKERNESMHTYFIDERSLGLSSTHPHCVCPLRQDFNVNKSGYLKPRSIWVTGDRNQIPKEKEYKSRDLDKYPTRRGIQARAGGRDQE